MSRPGGGRFDVAVVGGGVSGAYAAWRLMLGHRPAGRRPRIVLCEMSGRVGGRLLSVRSPGSGTVCELGGMRYLTSQAHVSALVRTLGLETFPQIVDRDENLVLLRGRTCTRKDLADSGALPYVLGRAERGLDPAELVKAALCRLIPGAQESLAAGDPSALRAALERASIEGMPLHRLGFWDVLLRALGSEAYHLVRGVLGYDSIASNANAFDLTLEFLDFAPGARYKRIKEGFEAVPRELARRFAEAGGVIRMGARLRGFEAGRGGVSLDFGDGAPVRASHLILALPRRSLELLGDTGPFGRELRGLLDTVRPVPLFKLFLCYPLSWWKSLGLSEGRSVTDLPLRQVYYWRTAPTGKPDESDGVLMVYNDQTSVDFWAGMRTRPGKHPLFGRIPHYEARHPSLGGVSGPPEWEAHRAPRRMVEEIHRQICELHGVRAVPMPFSAAYRDWSEDPYGAGVHFWRSGVRSREAMRRIAHPVPSLPVSIVGEAYSDRQGWVEGALRTAELVLQRRFGLRPPEGLERME